MKYKKGDTVKIIIGKDKGKTGKIMKSLPKDEKVLIEGLNLYKKHSRPKTQGEKGQVVTVPRPIHISNVALVCSSCGNSTRVGYRFESGTKKRYCKKCNADI